MSACFFCDARVAATNQTISHQLLVLVTSRMTEFGLPPQSRRDRAVGIDDDRECAGVGRFRASATTARTQVSRVMSDTYFVLPRYVYRCVGLPLGFRGVPESASTDPEVWFTSIATHSRSRPKTAGSRSSSPFGVATESRVEHLVVIGV